MNCAHKIELDLNNKQDTYFKKACGISRFAYNWALAEWNRLYKENKTLPKEQQTKISGMSLKKSFNGIKKEQFPWVMEVTKYAAQEPFLEVQDAFTRFFKKQNKYPKFKKKNKSKDSFYVGGDQLKLKENKIWVPNLGFVRMKELLRFEGKINSATFSRHGTKWFVSIQVDAPHAPIKKPEKDRIVGVDLGIKSLLVTSDGHEFAAILPLKSELKKLRREQRKLSKKIRLAKKEGRRPSEGKNIKKQKTKVSKRHYKVFCKRDDALHKITSFLTSNYTSIAIEDLHVKGMVKNHNLARSIHDAGFGKLRSQIEYKAKKKGVTVILINRFFPSSKTCYQCKHIKKELSLSERVFHCENCGYTQDRDLNAALNIREQIGRVPAELKPVEITAMQKVVYPLFVTSIVESGNRHQLLHG